MWQPQVENVIKRASKAKHAISLIKKYFKRNELNYLLTVYYYLILYYNADIWLIPSLKLQILQQLLSASPSAIKMSSGNYDNMVSFDQLHQLHKRATPTKMMAYKHSLLLFKIYNNNIYSKEWMALNFQQSFNDQVSTVQIFYTSNLKIGKI